MLIGGITGLEREKSHQFAGFRTHILILEGLQHKYYRIGFLGAGAILKTSNGIRGLTTAAGVWATACIGIAVGYGYYVLSILAWLFVMITLYILKNIDKTFFKKKQTILNIDVDNINIISMLYSKFEKSQILVKNIEIEENYEHYWKISFFIVYDRRIIINELVKELNTSKHIINVDYLH